MARSYFYRVNMEIPARFRVNNSTIKEAQFAVNSSAVSCTTKQTYVSKMIFHLLVNIILEE